MSPDPQLGAEDLEKGPTRPTRRRTMTLPAEERDWVDNIVLWDSKDDPANPKNWSMRRRFGITMLFGMTTSEFFVGLPRRANGS